MRPVDFLVFALTNLLAPISVLWWKAMRQPNRKSWVNATGLAISTLIYGAFAIALGFAMPVRESNGFAVAFGIVAAAIGLALAASWVALLRRRAPAIPMARVG